MADMDRSSIKAEEIAEELNDRAEEKILGGKPTPTILQYPLSDAQQPYGATIEFVVRRIITETFMSEEEIVRTDEVIVPDTNVYVYSRIREEIDHSLCPGIASFRGGVTRSELHPGIVREY
jgi:hypothetical protein